MTAILGTLPFLATLWLLVIVGAAILEESGAKIAAALKGEMAEAASPITSNGRSRNRTPVSRSRSARAPLRAAA